MYYSRIFIVGSIRAISAGLRIFPKGIQPQLDFWLRNRNNTIGYRPEISDLNRFNEALVWIGAGKVLFGFRDVTLGTSTERKYFISLNLFIHSGHCISFLHRVPRCWEPWSLWSIFVRTKFLHSFLSSAQWIAILMLESNLVLICLDQHIGLHVPFAFFLLIWANAFKISFHLKNCLSSNSTEHLLKLNLLQMNTNIFILQ